MSALRFAGVSGIDNGGSRPLEHNQIYLEQYAHYHAIASPLVRRTGRPYGEMEMLIQDKLDRGMQAAWKSQ